MKFHFCLIAISFIFFAGCACKQANNKIGEFNRIEMDIVSNEIMTPFSISCDKFEKYFKNSYKRIVIDNSKDILLIKKCLNKFEVNSKQRKINVRIKLYLYNDKNLISIFCLDQFGNIVLNNTEYLKNDCFVDYINNKIEN